MNHHYSDIRARIEEEPTWWDEYAVPRYGPFTPDDGADIYAREIALVLIRCQNCGAPFKVAFSWNAYRLNYERVEGVDHEGQPLFRMAPALSLSERIPEGRIHYGDPPNAGCCAAGPTMNCEDERVLEFWRKDWHDHDSPTHPWARCPELEIELPGWDAYAVPTRERMEESPDA